MKLLARQNRYYVAITAGLFALGSAGLFGGVRAVTRAELDEDLYADATRLRRLAGAGLAIAVPGDRQPTTPRLLLTRPAAAGLRDTTLPDPAEANEPTLYRQLVTPIPTPTGPRWLVVRRSLLEADDVGLLILGVLLPVMAALLGLLLLVNRWLGRRLWQPLGATLRAVAAYDGARPLHLSTPTDIDEFAQLNSALMQMSGRVAREIETLRQFTENAAHETQTPLAILRTGLDQLGQVPDLPPPAWPLLADAQAGVRRLSRLMQSLTLLSKIENGQFGAPTGPGARPAPVDLVPLVTDQLARLADFIAAKDLRLTLDLAPGTLPLPPALAESLVLNLLQNAVKHNLPGGTLHVATSAAGLLVRNSGPNPTQPPVRFFERFRKHDPTTDSPGLGLAIVAQIARAYNLELRYTFEPTEKQHVLQVSGA